MTRLLLGTAYSLCIIVGSLQMSAQAPQRVDLREWGYKTPEDSSSHFQRQLSSQLISVTNHGETAVGFVTRDRRGLATRELPPLSFHILRFTRSGKFISQLTIPTPSWHENALFYGSHNTLLVRTGTKLSLLSPEMERVAERELSAIRDSALINWKIYPLPNRTGFVLHNYRESNTSIALLNWDDLKPIKECPFSQYDQVLSVSNNDILSFHPSRADAPLRRAVEAGELCGRSQFSYSWEGGGAAATLIDDDSVVLGGGGSSVRLVVRDKVRWEETFDKNSDVVSDNIKSSADAHFVVIAVEKLAGGSQLLDIPRKLKALRVIVYEVKTGKKVSDIPLQSSSSSEFDFALSPAGDVLAIVSDGFLEIVPVKEQF